MKKFLLGALCGYVLLAGLGYLSIQEGWIQAAADRPPGALESWAAPHSLHVAIRRESRGLKDPLPQTDANLVAGAQLYAAHCLVCHGGADGKASATARGLGIPPPQLAKDGVEDDPEGETYWKVAHGIRFTGMPAYGSSLGESSIWQISQFVAHLDHLPPAADAAWKAMPSQGDR